MRSGWRGVTQRELAAAIAAVAPLNIVEVWAGFMAWASEAGYVRGVSQVVLPDDMTTEAAVAEYLTAGGGER